MKNKKIPIFERVQNYNKPYPVNTRKHKEIDVQKCRCAHYDHKKKRLNLFQEVGGEGKYDPLTKCKLHCVIPCRVRFRSSLM